MPSRNPAFQSLSRRRFLAMAGVAGAGLALRPSMAAASKAPSGVRYSFVNKTNGKFLDDQCFWSLDGGGSWYSFAAQPTVPCPNGSGRVYFRLGPAPTNFDDYDAYWDFIEYSCGDGTWHGNTTLVDSFCIPITIEMGGRKLGIETPRSAIFDSFKKEAPEEFKGCCRGDFRILSPCRAGFGKDGPHGRYFDLYMDEIWKLYAREKATPGGKWTGKVVNQALVFTPAGGGQPLSCPRKPTTQEILLGTNILSSSPQFCAAANRHVLSDPADWHDSSKFYRAQPCNWYARFFHEKSIDRKCYGFCYDDVAEQASFFSVKGDNLVVSLRWD